jgi:glycerophosphoryl diester phosphodiesterase
MIYAMMVGLVFAAVFGHFSFGLVKAFFLFADLAFYNQSAYPLAPPVESRLVAHAGGAVRGLVFTNSREALDEHYSQGYKVFELDFAWTTDHRLVLVHDWATTSTQFGKSPHIFSRDEFVTSTRVDGLHSLTFEDLCAWLRNHPDAAVVTDTKENNLRLLEYLRHHGGDILPQLIIQIYWLSELPAARQLRPRAVWLTCYKNGYPAWALSKLAGVDAFVIPVGEYKKYYQPQLMARSHFYVHSIAADSVAADARTMPGIYGFYVN